MPVYKISCSEVAALTGRHPYVPRPLAIQKWLAKHRLAKPSPQQAVDQLLSAMNAQLVLDKTDGTEPAIRTALETLAQEYKLDAEATALVVAQVPFLARMTTGRKAEADITEKEQYQECNTKWVRYPIREDLALTGRLDARAADGTWIEIKRRMGMLAATPPSYDLIQVQAYMHALSLPKMILQERDAKGVDRKTVVVRDDKAWNEIETELVRATRLALRLADDPFRCRAFIEHVDKERWLAAERVLDSCLPKMAGPTDAGDAIDLAIEQELKKETEQRPK
jgi:hypothetical protein